MNLINLSEAVSNLSGGEGIDDRALLITSVNMALTELHLRIPIIKKVKCNIRSFIPKLYHAQIDSTDGLPVTLPIEGMTYSMRLMGRGTYCIRDGEFVTTAQFNTGNGEQILRGIIFHGGTIQIWGGFAFSICDFALYDQIASMDENDIPIYSATRKYNLRETLGDFLSFVAPATDINGRVIENCSLLNGEMEIDATFNGEVMITYRRTHPAISYLDEANDGLKMIEVPAEYESLLLYLTAYFYWRSESESKANFFRERFDALVSMVDDTYRCIDHSYTDVNGWA